MPEIDPLCMSLGELTESIRGLRQIQNDTKDAVHHGLIDVGHKIEDLERRIEKLEHIETTRKSIWKFVNNGFKIILKAVRDVRPLKFFGSP